MRRIERENGREMDESDTDDEEDRDETDSDKLTEDTVPNDDDDGKLLLYGLV